MAVLSSCFAFLMFFSLTISIHSAEPHASDNGDNNGCTDGVCLAKNSFASSDDPDKLHNYQDDAMLETQAMRYTMTTVEMYRAQREVAHYLEMALLLSVDHADVSKEIRLTAHKSRAQHLMTSGLMKNFAATAFNIVSTKIPQLFAGLEMKNPTVLKAILNQIIAKVEEMKIDTEKTRGRNYDLHGQLRNDIETVKTKTEVHRKKSAELNVKFEKEKLQAKLAKEHEEMLKKKKAVLEKDIQKLKQRRDDLYDSARREQENMKDYTFGPGMGGIGLILDQIGNILSHIFGFKKTDNLYQELMKAYREADESVRRKLEGQNDIINQILENREKALRNLDNLKKIVRQQDRLGDIAELYEAENNLGHIDTQFTLIITFWENMASYITSLRDDVVDRRTFVDMISEPVAEKEFRQGLIRTEKNWKFFGKMCTNYIEESDREVHTLYRFLSESIDNKSAEARRKREEEIIAQIEDEIDSALPSMDDPD